MLRNAEIEAAWSYHNGTKHSLASVQASHHTLDWANQPIPYKRYRDLEPIPLPRDLPGSRAPALTAIANGGTSATPPPLDLPLLATLLHHTAGITRRLRFPGGMMDFRAAACTGALYHIDFYVVCGSLAGLEAGVYHFGVHDFALRRLRAGDFRGVPVAATGNEAAVAHAPAILVATSTYWRNSWKYQARTYRHCWWDLGTCLANLLAVSVAHGLPARVVLGFVDADVNRLIDVDGEREAALALIPIGTASEPPSAASEVPRLELPILPYSHHEVDEPMIHAMHAASALETPDAVTAWRAAVQAMSVSLTDVPHQSGRAGANQAPEPASPARSGDERAPGAVLPLPTVLSDGYPPDPIETVIQKRGSSRRFRRDPISLEQLGTMLHAATRGIPADFRAGPGLRLNQAYLIANAVDGLPSGSYVYEPDTHALVALAMGSFRERAGALALNQDLAADAAVNLYFLADLEAVLGRLGNRGYRAAHLEASTTAGKVYLAAYALGLGASGLTFFDDDVTAFFSPHATGKSVMFLITTGHPRRRGE